jgi:NADH-quinone oxidoreductase subunit J
MTFSEWITDARNIVFLLIALTMVGAALVVVLTRNVVHAALTLVVALGGSAALFLMLGAEFVAWTVILVYIGAVIILFLFGIMITRAPIGRDAVRLDHTRRWPAVLIAASMFAVMAWSTTAAFGGEEISEGVLKAENLGDLLFSRYVIPFEAVSFVLLAALVGGIVLARKDPDR